MVRTMLKSSLREIRQSLGRYLAILAISGLGVGFFAGLRMSQPSMMATGVDYLKTYQLFDFQLISTLGFTEEDVEYFSTLKGVQAARGGVYTDFLMELADGGEAVLTARSLTEDVNIPELAAGRMPEAANECLADARHFTEADLGTALTVSSNNSEDTLELLTYDSYTIVGLIYSPYYLNYQRGTSSIGSGSVAAFVYIPEDGFTFDAYYEIYLTLSDAAEAYSDEYEDQIDSLKGSIEDATEERAALRYETLYRDGLEAIEDAEAEIADGWEEYHTELADVGQELADAYQELQDGEQEYADGFADYEQGRLDYADGLKKYEDGLAEVEDAEQKLTDGWADYEQAKADAEQELADAKKELQDGEQEYADGLKKYEDGLAEVEDAEAEIADGERELLSAKLQLSSASSQLSAAQAQLSSAKEQLDATKLQLDAAKGQLDALGQQLSLMTPETPGYAELSAQYQQGMAQYEAGMAQYEAGMDQYQEGLTAYQSSQAKYTQGLREYERGKAELSAAKDQLEESKKELEDAKTQLD